MTSEITLGILQSTVAMATPLLLAAQGETVVQKSGVVNVGLDGMMLVGAFAATLLTRSTHSPWLGVGAGAVAGMGLALLAAIFTVRLLANQVVVGVVINLLALGLTGTLYRKMFGTTGTTLITESLPKFAKMTLLTPFAVVLTLGTVWWLHRTRAGLELRACGEQPSAAEASGVSVPRTRLFALLFGGAMAGVAGAFLSVGDGNTFIENMTDGRGFIALAIVTSGRWNPVGALIATVVFGLAQALQFQGQALGLKLPYQIFSALPYLVTLCVLTLGSTRSAAPAALGRPYRKAS